MLFWLTLLLTFLTVFLLVWAGGDWLGNRLAAERSMYERVVGKELHRLFLPISAKEFIIYHGLFLLFAPVVGYLLSGILGVVIGAIAGIFGPRLYLKWRWKKRLEEIDEQTEEAMVLMANSFKANPSLPDAIEDVIAQMRPPITQELEVVLKEYRLGTPLDQCLINLRQRVPARYLGLAVQALVIGRTVGGNIPNILEEIAGTIRESYRLERIIDKQTAQGRMQAWVMGLMPAVVIGAFYWLDEDLMGPLFETWIGYGILTVAGILNVIGVALILKIVRIEV